MTKHLRLKLTYQLERSFKPHQSIRTISVQDFWPFKVMIIIKKNFLYQQFRKF